MAEYFANEDVLNFFFVRMTPPPPYPAVSKTLELRKIRMKRLIAVTFCQQLGR